MTQRGGHKGRNPLGRGRGMYQLSSYGSNHMLTLMRLTSG